MHVIAGSARGCKLKAPEGMDTRPITSKIKESLFNIWQMKVVDASFLDLFSGSGSVGIEALSRGASRVVFVEKNRKAINIINDNLKYCHFDRGVEVYQDDVFNRILKLQNDGSKFDIIYLDPPFTVDEIFYPVMEEVSKANILENDGVLAIRTTKEKVMLDEFNNLVKFREKRYGLSTMHFYKYKD